MGDPTERYARLALGAVAALVVLTVFVGASTSAASFSAYNSAWNGAAHVEDVAADSETDFEVATAVGPAYDRPTSTVTLVLSPDRPYTQQERARIRQFVTSGGRLVVADDFGQHANQLLAGIGAQTRIDGRLLRDERRYYRTPNMTLARVTSNSTPRSSSESDRTLTLNHGTVLRPNGATVLATSSEFSYVDANRNYELDEREVVRSRPVVTRESVGNGTVVVASDPSLFINAMVDRPGNRAFVRSLLSGRERAVVDYSHAERVPPFLAALLWIRAHPLAQVLCGVGALSVVGAVTTHRDRVESLLGLDGDDDRSTPDTDAIAAYLATTRPEWTERDIRTVMTGIITTDTKEREDD